jgi:hypothetical protein
MHGDWAGLKTICSLSICPRGSYLAGAVGGQSAIEGAQLRAGSKPNVPLRGLGAGRNHSSTFTEDRGSPGR